MKSNTGKARVSEAVMRRCTMVIIVSGEYSLKKKSIKTDIVLRLPVIVYSKDPHTLVLLPF